MFLPEPTRTVQVDELPKCQFDEKTAVYDTKTTFGPFAYVCEEHYKQYGRPPTTKLEKRVKIGYKSSKTLIVHLPITAIDETVEIKCPHCGEPRLAESGAYYKVICDSCGNRYRIVPS